MAVDVGEVVRGLGVRERLAARLGPATVRRRLQELEKRTDEVSPAEEPSRVLDRESSRAQPQQEGDGGLADEVRAV